MKRARVLILSEVTALIAESLSMEKIRTRLKCDMPTLQRFMGAHNLETACPPQGSTPALVKHFVESRIPMGKGGDAEFTRLMNGREFDRIIFKPSAFGPIHKPHRIPGDDFSTCGSSMRHDSGSPGMRVSGGGGR